MNLDELLDVTEPVTVKFMGHDVTAHVYTAGAERLTREDQDLILKFNDSRVPVDTDLPEPEQKAKKREADFVGILSIRAVLPIIVSGVDLDGDPLEYKGKQFPENVNSFPDALLIALGNAALDKWNAGNPTDGLEQQNGSQPEAIPEQSQAESITPLSM